MSSISSRIFLRVFFSLLVLLCAGVSARADEQYTLALNWVPHSLHFGVYLAKERGWYHDAGLNIVIQRGYGSGDTVKRVGTGSADFGMADAASVALGRANSIDTKLIAMLMDRPADAIYFVKNADIKSPADLQDRTMGAAAGETSLNLLPVFAKHAQIDASKISIVTMSSPNKIPSLVQGKVDSILTFTNEEPMVMHAGKIANREIGRFLFADYGVDYYSIGLIASDKMIASKPDVVKAFVSATMRGYAEALAKPDEALDDFIKDNPESSSDLMREQWSTLRYNVLSPTSAAKGLGYMEEGKMKETLDLMRDFQNLKADVKPGDVYTLDFLPRIEVKP
jgi:NitT/TauT family transport system substrate-binding protein